MTVLARRHLQRRGRPSVLSDPFRGPLETKLRGREAQVEGEAVEAGDLVGPHSR